MHNSVRERLYETTHPRSPQYGRRHSEGRASHNLNATTAMLAWANKRRSKQQHSNFKRRAR
jgi:hypothetical protein